MGNEASLRTYFAIVQNRHLLNKQFLIEISSNDPKHATLQSCEKARKQELKVTK